MKKIFGKILLIVFALFLAKPAIAVCNNPHVAFPPWIVEAGCAKLDVAVVQCEGNKGILSASKQNCVRNSWDFLDVAPFTWETGGAYGEEDCCCTVCPMGYVLDDTWCGCEPAPTCIPKTVCSGCVCTTTAANCSTSQSCDSACCGGSKVVPSCGSSCGANTCCDGSSCRTVKNNAPGSDTTGSFNETCNCT